ncbi:MAG TPA: zf-HC2 domain-containing protein [Gemmatimonadaceae bacterium]
MRHPDEGTGLGRGPLADDEHLDEGTIHAWLDGALDADEGARIERHAASCAACAAMVAEARGLVAAASRILTRLDDVPAGVTPPATLGAPERARADDLARARRRRWIPAAWMVSAAAAAAVTVLLVSRDDIARLTSESVSVESVSAESAPDAVTAESAIAAPMPESPPVPSVGARQPEADAPPRADAGGAAASRTEPVPGASVGRVGAEARAAEPRFGARPPAAPREREEAAAGFAQAAPAPVASAATAAANEVTQAGARGMIAGVRDSVGAAAQDLAEVARTEVEGAALAAEVPVPSAMPDTATLRVVDPSWSDSLSRARLPRRIGIGARILSGARLVTTTIEASGSELERRSVYVTEDGAVVTLVEGPGAVHLEAIVTTGADAPAESAAKARPETQQRVRGNAPLAQRRAMAAAPDADSVRAAAEAGRETVVVRPDGVTRLEWRDGGTRLAIEGRVPIERLRELRDRVRF